MVFARAGAAQGGDGRSWATAYASLQDALAALATQPDAELWVAGGTYTAGGREASFTTPQGLTEVALYGGFAGNEGHRDDRLIYEHPSILSGDNAGDDADAKDDDNSRHVLHFATEATVLLDGFTVVAGRAEPGDSQDSSAGDGGGILLTRGTLRLQSCTIRGNEATAAGGGVAVNGATLQLGADTWIFENTASWGGGISVADGGRVEAFAPAEISANEALEGGGIFLGRGTELTGYEMLEIRANTAGLGGGLRMDAAAVVLASGEIVGNVAKIGGGIFSEHGTLELNDVLLNLNVSRQGGGGAVHLVGGELALTDGWVSGNSAPRGGGIFCDSADLTISSSVLQYNVASQSNGGAVEAVQCRTLLEKDELASNGAPFAGGGAIWLLDGEATVRDCAFTENAARAGGGAIAGHSPGPVSNITIGVFGSRFNKNSAGNGGGFWIDRPGWVYGEEVPEAVSVHSSEFRENTAVDYGGGIFGQARIRDCSFIGNSARSGGGIGVATSTNTSPMEVVGCRFDGNVAKEDGGAWYDRFGSYLFAANLTIVNNRASNRGGGVFMSGSSVTQTILANALIAMNEAGTEGGGIYAESPLAIHFSTIAFNSAPSLSQVSTPVPTPELWTRVDLFRTIITGPADSGVQFTRRCPSPIPNPCWLCAYGSFITDLETPEDGISNENPLLIAPETGDYNLAPESPAIDEPPYSSSSCPEWTVDYPLDDADLDHDTDVEERLPIDLAGRPRATAHNAQEALPDAGALERQPE